MHINNLKTELHTGRRPKGHAPQIDSKHASVRDPLLEMRSRPQAQHEHKPQPESGFGAQPTTQAYPLARIRKLMELSHRYHNRSSPTASTNTSITQAQMLQQINASVHMRPLVNLYQVNQNPFGLQFPAAPLPTGIGNGIGNGTSPVHASSTAPTSQTHRKLGVVNAVDLESVSTKANSEMQVRQNPHAQLSLPEIPAYLMWNLRQNRIADCPVAPTRQLAKQAPVQQQPQQMVRIDILESTPFRFGISNSNWNSKQISPSPVPLVLAEARTAVRVTPEWTPENATPAASNTPQGGSAPPHSTGGSASAAIASSAPDSAVSSTLSRVADVLNCDVHSHVLRGISPRPLEEQPSPPPEKTRRPSLVPRPSLTKAPARLPLQREFTVNEAPKRPPPLKRTSISILPPPPGPQRLRKAKTSLNFLGAATTGSHIGGRRSSFGGSGSGSASSGDEEGTPPPSTKHINCRRPLPAPMPIPRRARRPSNKPPLPETSFESKSTVSIAEEAEEEDVLPHTPPRQQTLSARSTPLCPATPPPQRPEPLPSTQPDEIRAQQPPLSCPKTPNFAANSHSGSRPSTGRAASGRGNRATAKSARRRTHNMLVVTAFIN